VVFNSVHEAYSKYIYVTVTALAVDGRQLSKVPLPRPLVSAVFKILATSRD
jgi:hypothetical protein